MASFITHSVCHRQAERWVDSQRHDRPDAAFQRHTCACTSLRGLHLSDRQALVGKPVLAALQTPGTALSNPVVTDLRAASYEELQGFMKIQSAKEVLQLITIA